MVSRSIVSAYQIDKKEFPFVLNIAVQSWAVSAVMLEAEKFGNVFAIDNDGRWDFQIELHGTYDVNEFADHLYAYGKSLLSDTPVP